MTTSTENVRVTDNARTPDYVERYANNVRFETSAWDLKLVFGLLDQDALATRPIQQHTAMHLPWPQAKLMWYYLSLNIAFQENTHGEVVLPQGTVPDPPGSIFTNWDEVPNGKQLLARLDRLYDQLLTINYPAIPPQTLAQPTK